MPASLVRITSVTLLLAALSVPSPGQSLDGFWQSDGYGLLVQVQGARMTTYQTTSISCVRWWTAHRSYTTDTSSEVVFRRADADIRLARGPSPDRLQMREGPSISQVTIKRTSDQAEVCKAPLEDTPQNNYSVFWQTFAEQFALFPVYRTDWDSVDRKYRPRVTTATSLQDLFAIMREMILPFHNAHTNIIATSIGRQYLGYRPASEIGRRLQSADSVPVEHILALFKDQAQRSKAIVEARYSVGPLQFYANDMIHFGLLRDSIGYLRVLAFEGYSNGGRFDDDAAALERALDTIFARAERMNGLIIDVRVNTGGADPLALAIAARLTNTSYVAYSKVARNNLAGALHFTSPQVVWVDASPGPSYRGNVVLLIGPETISGGETFAMALMGRSPRVTFVGDNTQGVFSDVWGRKLPNGWTFAVPTELYRTPSGISFDAAGVPPHIRVDVFPNLDLEAGRDGALERAIRVIDDGGRTRPRR